MIPHERSLVNELEDEPFALLGINSDGDAAKLRDILDKQELSGFPNWRHWVDGSTSGPIATRWNVHGWPTIYVLDKQGVIRYRDVRNKELEDAVKTLLAEPAAPAGDSGH
jgi:hypothetical protein